MSAIYSMTGFASLRSSAKEGLGFTLTMKSVNHRFLDLNLRLPSSCDGLEMQMRRTDTSIADNLAEGCATNADAELSRFCSMP